MKLSIGGRALDAIKVKVTEKMILAGVEVLSDWKYEMDFVSEQKAVEEIYRVMAAISATHLPSKRSIP